MALKSHIMNLTKEKLIALWKDRTEIFAKKENDYIVNRYKMIGKLFDDILNFKYEETYDAITIDGEKVLIDNIRQPSRNYFSCKEDEMTAPEAFQGVIMQADRFPNKFKDFVLKIGCLLGGFDFDDDHDHPMKDDYRIISNSTTGKHDNSTLTSKGQIRHPSSHFADNNYFFNVIDTIQKINSNNFSPNSSKLVLRWPNDTYYKDETEAEQSQKETLKHRFPYKFFYMWTHKEECLHLVSLMAYKNFVQQDEVNIQYQSDKNMDQSYDDFTRDWKLHSQTIQNMIPEELRGDNFFDEISKLLSIIMIQDQDMRNIQELLETGNKAVILYGPPGTGKTFQAKNIVLQELGLTCKNDDNRNKLLEENKFPNIGEKGTWTLVQFHPNYTYEDFIGGISPKLSGDTLSYQLKVGLFKEFCDKANEINNNGKNFIMIIDEINRADLSSVFGELMYALEYRGESVSIPNFDEPFVIPSNVYVIGTMNSIDKSLVTFDLALRRRFGFYKLMPQLKVLESILAEYNVEEETLVKYIERCENLNNEIASSTPPLQLGPEYQIGQAYFGKIKDFLTKPEKNDNNPKDITILELEKLWTYHIEPLLQEYLGNRVDDSEVKKKIKDIQNVFTKPLQ